MRKRGIYVRSRSYHLFVEITCGMLNDESLKCFVFLNHRSILSRKLEIRLNLVRSDIPSFFAMKRFFIIEKILNFIF